MRTNMSEKRMFWYENPSGSDIPIYFDEIEEMAIMDGFDVQAEDLDDITFYNYCARIAEGL